MKLFNPRAKWCIEGMLLATLPPHFPLTAQEMQAFYIGVKYGTVNYKMLRRSSPYPRKVILTADNRFLIVPITPDIQVIHTEIS